MDPFLSKHDPYAYQGKMDRLTFSNQMRTIYDILSDSIHELEGEKGHELTNLRIQAKNELAYEIMAEVEELVARVMDTDEKTLDWYWNISELKSQYEELEKKYEQDKE